MGLLRIGRLELASLALLAPLERVSNVAFRALCAANGAGLTFTEMVRAKSLAAELRVVDLVDTIDPATPTGLQLLAADAAELTLALNCLEASVSDGRKPHWANIRVVDLNFGCPKPEIAGLGPALLKDARRVGAMFDALAEWRARTALRIDAVGAKVRLGATADERDRGIVLDLLPAAAATLDYLTIHGRDAEALPSDPARWDEIARVKDAADAASSSSSSSSLKIIGNGDVRSRREAAALLRQTGCDAVMVARAAIHNPWLFTRLQGDLVNDEPSDYDERWPDLATLDRAEFEARAWERRFRRTRNKYKTFRRLNFQRIRDFVTTGFMPPRPIGTTKWADDEDSAPRLQPAWK